MMSVCEAAKTVISRLTGGFRADWDQDFRGRDDTYVTAGPDWSTGIPEHETEAMVSARDYTMSVHEAILKARDHENMAIAAASRHDYKQMLECLHCAEIIEAEFGASPTYGPLVDMLRIALDSSEAA